MNKRYNAY